MVVSFLARLWPLVANYHIMFRAALVGLLCLPVFSLAESITITAEQWARPRSGSYVTGLTALNEQLARIDRAGDSRLILHCPGDEKGMLWAEELRAWLVALGVPSARIQLKPDFGQIDIIRVEIQGSGG